MVCRFQSRLHRASQALTSKGAFYTNSRLIYAAGRERYLPALFGRVHPTRKTPLNAALLQAFITITFVVIGGGFRSLVNFSVVASWAFYFLTVRIIFFVSKAIIFKYLGPGFGYTSYKRANARKVRLSVT